MRQASTSGVPAPTAAGLVLVLALVAGPAAAQSNDEIQTGTQFNFSTPGARSLGMGGAFLGTADDATAAYTNPAGLTQLPAPEISLEARTWSYTSLFAAGGHAPPEGVTGIGIDTAPGVTDGEIGDRTAALSFFSYVHAGHRWALALYRHQLADFAASLESQGPFVGPRNNPTRVFPARSRLTLEIGGFGLAGAYRLTDRLSLGLGAAYYDFSLASRSERFFRAEPTGDLLQDGLTGYHYGPADFLPGNVANTQVQTGDDGDWVVSLGFLWRPSGRWSLGGAWRQGPDFAFRATFTDGPASPAPGRVDPTLGGDGVFHAPDVLALGVAYRPTDSLVVAFDWERVAYSQMQDDLVNLLRAAQGDPGRFTLDDGDALHLGVEYQALRLRLPVSLRCGAWLDPDHRIRYQGANALLRTRFRAGDDELHLAAGVGVVTGRTQLDLAVDHSDRVQTLSLSTVVRF